METLAPESYRLSKVANILKISRSLTLRLVRSGELPCSRTPEGLRVEEDKLRDWVQQQIFGNSPLAKEYQNK